MMDKIELLTRSYERRFDSYNCSYLIDGVFVSEGDSLTAGQKLFTVKQIKEVKKDNEIVKERTKLHINFDSKIHTDVTIRKLEYAKGDAIKGLVSLFDFDVEDNFRNLISKPIYSFSKKRSEVHSNPVIPEIKLANALKEYGGNVDANRVLYLYDDTVFGSAKDGFLISDTSFMYKRGGQRFNFRFLDYLSSEIKVVSTGAKSTETQTVLAVYYKEDGTQKELKINAGGILDVTEFKIFLDLTKTLNDGEYIKEVDSYVIIEDLSDTIKLNYLKAIVCFTHMDDGEVDSDEVSEIQTLMTQLNFNAELRHQVREMIISASGFDFAKVIDDIKVELQSGAEQVIMVSLLKDIVRVHSSTKETDATNDALVKEVSGILGITDAQLDFIHEAYLYDKKILAGDISDDELKKGAKILAGKAGAVGVPIAAIYLSGSVVGLSAAGLTSGLATLGLGGVLGLSSMVSGIGVVILLGVGVYKGMQWALGGAERNKASRREFMLQEVLRIHQKTISNLAEDVNYFSMKIIEALEFSEKNKLQIQKLAKQMSLFSNVIKSQKAKIEMYETDLEEESSKRESKK
jgi:hypothetical protein